MFWDSGTMVNANGNTFCLRLHLLPEQPPKSTNALGTLPMPTLACRQLFNQSSAALQPVQPTQRPCAVPMVLARVSRSHRTA
jgi:hypothetical protein